MSSSAVLWTTPILSGSAPRPTNASRICSVHVIVKSANRMLACSTAPTSAHAPSGRAAAPNLVAKNSGMHSCRSRTTRAPVSFGTSAANTSGSGSECTCTSL